jgi:hypothetical protein
MEKRRKHKGVRTEICMRSVNLPLDLNVSVFDEIEGCVYIGQA